MQEASFKIYNASAGSGKTYTLAKAYLTIILSSPKSYRQILAITFTNKAVNEMKHRILDSLYHFGLKEVPKKSLGMFNEISLELQIDALTLQQRSRSTLKEILHNYSFFDVSTIDKFTHRLIRTFARDLKLPQNFEVLLDTDLLLAESVALLIDRAGTDTELTQVLIDFALEKIDDNKSWDVAYDLNKFGKLLFDENQSPHLKKLQNKPLSDFLELKKVLRKGIVAAEKTIIGDATEVLRLITENGLVFGDFYKKQLPDFMVLLRDQKPNVNFDAGWKNDFENSPLYVKNCPDDVKSTIDALTPSFIELFDTIRSNHMHWSFLKNAYGNIVPLTVLNAIQQEIRTLLAKRDQLAISDFNTIISNEIKNQPAPFIYERLGEKYRHYFIDEFQDTSVMQWNNLIPLISNALESQDQQGNLGSVFLVGDAKQAIYRWRGGRAEQLLTLVNENDNPFVKTPEIQNLPRNYRSRQEVVNFNNDFFSVTAPFLTNELYQYLFEQGNQQAHTSEIGGLVQLNFIEKGDGQKLDDLYCAEVQKTIEFALDKKFALNDIAVLVRDNKHGILLANFLTQQGIPVISPDSLLIKTNRKVKFLIHLLQLSSQPDDQETKYNLLAFLAAEKDNKHAFIQRHLPSLVSYLNSEYGFDLDYLGKVSVYDGLEYAIKQFQLVPDSDAHVLYFMDVVFEVERRFGTGIQTFLAYWEKKKDRLGIAAPENMEAIQIMSVHKAKGLEFPVVIFPFANTPLYKEIDPKLWLPVIKEEFHGFEELLISKKNEVLQYGPVATEIYNEEQHKLELDAFNVLYVALTRAINAVFIITEKDLTAKGEPKIDRYSGLFIHYLQEKMLWNGQQLYYSFGNLVEAKRNESSRRHKNIKYPYSFKERASFRILARSGMLWDTDVQQARNRGKLIHHIMGLIKSEKDIGDALVTLHQNGDLAHDEMNDLEVKIKQIVNHVELKPYFEEGNEVLNERDIITNDGFVLRPDRIVLKNKLVTLIDYKTGKENEAYRDQLKNYTETLESMGYEVENKIIVYINESIQPQFI
ncbi:MAG: UvrD-helicase domain-containing protein [Maribacter sp.]|nr:UvrD-helicase domain-containing protein [Maribacter sp.]